MAQDATAAEGSEALAAAMRTTACRPTRWANVVTVNQGLPWYLNETLTFER